MKHSIHFDEKNGIARVSIIGNLSGPEADEMVEKFMEILKDKPFRQAIFNLEEAGTIEKRQDRQNVVDMLKRIQVSEIATIGGSAVARILAKIIHKMSKQVFKLQFFTSEDEALAWLETTRRIA